MSVRVNTLSEAEIRSIGDAFADFVYAESVKKSDVIRIDK